MLSREAYAGWAEKFGTVHGFRFGEETEMLAAWYDVLGHYALDELDAAKVAIAQSSAPTPARKEEYRSLVHRAVSAYRADRYRRESGEVQGEEWGECLMCSSTGWVTVPHVACIAQGQWIHPEAEMVVTCLCPLGHFKRQRFATGKAPWSMERYEKTNPLWRKQWARRKAITAAEFAKQPVCAGPGIARDLPAILLKLKQKIGREPGQDEG